jgi:hypothetical protein
MPILCHSPQRETLAVLRRDIAKLRQHVGNLRLCRPGPLELRRESLGVERPAGGGERRNQEPEPFPALKPMITAEHQQQ